MKEKVTRNELGETKNTDRRDRKRREWRGRTVDYVITPQRDKRAREREREMK